MNSRSILPLLLALLAGCVTPTPASAPPADHPKPTYGTFGVDTTGMDPKAAPGDSFYRYANGAWHDRTEIPPDRTAYGMFTVLTETAQQRTREIIEAAAKANAAPGTDERKLGDYFASYMDEAGIEAKGTSPLQPELDRIAKLTSVRDLSALLGDTLRADVDVLNTGASDTDRFFGLWVTEDLGDPSRYAPYLLQGGLGMPDRDYYLTDNARFADLRTKYQQHIAAMLKLAGLPDADTKAKSIFALEKKIAEAHWPQVDTQDVAKTNNPWPRSEFAKRAPGLDWEAYFTAAHLASQPTVIVWQPSALQAMSKLVASEPLQTWKDYLAFHAIERSAKVLPKAFVEESFNFNDKTLAGAEKLKERWKRAVDATDDALGEVIGRAYVKQYFPPEAKAQADAMVKNIVAALGRHIDNLAWMSPATKTRAKEKLTTLQVGIGYPDRWRDYSSLEVVNGDAYGNLDRVGRYELQRNLRKLGGPVDRQEWFMNPQLVNALNSPQQNSIIFPAAILQPPFFDPAADPAVNYGAVGAVIGHEISHSFDDVGAQFDAQGKLANWWTDADLKQFKAAGEALAKQYDTYAPFPDAHVNGELTLGENIADVAGIAIAFDGWKASLGGKPAPVLDGFTGEQRFFLGFAQVWRTKYREPALRRMILTNGHSPGEYRAQTVRNIDAWYDAFAVKPGQQLFLAPEARVRIW